MLRGLTPTTTDNHLWRYLPHFHSLIDFAGGAGKSVKKVNPPLKVMFPLLLGIKLSLVVSYQITVPNSLNFCYGKKIDVHNAYPERLSGKRVIFCTTAHFTPLTSGTTINPEQLVLKSVLLLGGCRDRIINQLIWQHWRSHIGRLALVALATNGKTALMGLLRF